MTDNINEISQIPASKHQRFSEALFKLCTLVYQIDGCIKLSEVAIVDGLLKPSEWENQRTSLDNFKIAAITECRAAIDHGNVNQLLLSLRDDLLLNANIAMETAYHVSAVDDHVCDKEASLLKYLKNKLLAPALDHASN